MNLIDLIQNELLQICVIMLKITKYTLLLEFFDNF